MLIGAGNEMIMTAEYWRIEEEVSVAVRALTLKRRVEREREIWSGAQVSHACTLPGSHTLTHVSNSSLFLRFIFYNNPKTPPTTSGDLTPKTPYQTLPFLFPQRQNKLSHPFNFYFLFINFFFLVKLIQLNHPTYYSIIKCW